MGSQLLKLSVFSSGHVITTSGSNGASEQKLKRGILILKPLLSYYRRYWSAAPRRSWAVLKSTSTDPFSKVAIMGVLDLDEAISPKCGFFSLLDCNTSGWIRSFVADYWICISSIWCCNCMDANGCIDLGGLLRVTAGYGTKVSLSVGSDGQPDIIKEWQIEERQLRFASMVYLGEQYVKYPTLSDVTLMIEGKRFYAHIICLLASSDAFRAMFDGGYRQGTQERDHSSERIGMFSRKVWNCRRVNLRVHSVVKKAHLGLVTALAFSQDSRALVFASLDSSARVTQIKETKNNEEKTHTDKNMSTMFDVLRRNRTVQLETLVLKCKPWLMICHECSDYFPKIPHGLDPVYSMFKQHVAAEGTTLVKQSKDAASNKKVEKRLQVHPAT
ncbi:unnamed protein product [Lactuca saligna]|uniref:BTB domain-containing protein n=1 Tax=Lactuca saligna TaxID=75948 RepID=A0AA35Y6C2_LACSI|nr:unnamed protein product [Lactuca saligna]